MKKPKKSSPAGKRRQSGNSPARPGTAGNIRRKAAGHSSPRPDVNSAQSAGALPGSSRNREEGKRKLWERKQAELEARWLSAQTRRNAEDAARRRKMKIGYGMVGAVLAASALAWWLV